MDRFFSLMQCCLILLILSGCCSPCHCPSGGLFLSWKTGSRLGVVLLPDTQGTVSMWKPHPAFESSLLQDARCFSASAAWSSLHPASLGLWFLPGALAVIFRVVVFYPAYFQLCWNLTVSGHLRILLAWGQSFRLTSLWCSLCLAQSSVREPCVLDSLWSLGLTMDSKRDLLLHLWTTLFFIT